MTTARRQAFLIATNAKHPEPRFTEQKEAVKATGATFSSSARRWLYEIEDLANPSPEDINAINALFAAAKEYGTDVKFVAAKDTTPPTT